MFTKANSGSIISFGRLPLSRGAVFGTLILTALLAFEMFNYSTTEYSLTDLLGSLQFLGLRWATILAIAFCTMDFAGLARLFTPEQGAEEPAEVWYLFGAWILASIMNAMLTWWGVSVAIVSHNSSANTMLDPDLILKVVPIFVAILVFLIRVLIIGTFTVAGERLFSEARKPRTSYSPMNSGSQRSVPAIYSKQQHRPSVVAAQASSHSKPDAKSTVVPGFTRPEPTYHPLSVSGNRNLKHMA